MTKHDLVSNLVIDVRRILHARSLFLQNIYQFLTDGSENVHLIIAVFIVSFTSLIKRILSLSLPQTFKFWLRC